MVFAYLDPGAGSMLFQALLAAALTAPLFFRSKISALVATVRGRSRGDRAADRQPEHDARD